jgi:transposase
LTSDEAGFNLLASRMRTYAPCGQTPVVQQDCKYSHLSAISAISQRGEMLSKVIKGNFDGVAIVEFLKELLRQFKKEIHLVWDGAKIHCSEAVKEFLRTDNEAKRLFLYRIPPYSPELNPTEQLWHYIKNVELKNVFSKNLKELDAKLAIIFNDFKFKKNITRAFFKHPNVKF